MRKPTVLIGKYQKMITPFALSPQQCFLVRLLSHFLSDVTQMNEPNSLQPNESVEM